MSIRDALFKVVHDYPGGANSLAPRMDLAASTLRCMANPTIESHDWPLKRVEQVMALTGDTRPLDALCEEFGGVFVRLSTLPDGEEEIGRMIAELGADFGAVCASINSALADGRVTAKELKEFEARVYQMNAASQALKLLVERRANANPLNRPPR